MPRFFFHVYDGVSIRDEDGVELPDAHAARVGAIRYAGRLIEDDASRLKLGEEWRMEVTDEAGLILFRLDFHVAAAPAMRDDPTLRP